MAQDIQTLIIYTHPDCDASAQLKLDYKRQGIAFKEIDVTEVPGAVKELEKLTDGEHLTPVIVEGDEVTIGYGGVGCAF